MIIRSLKKNKRVENIINDCRFIKRGVDEGYDTKSYNYKYINRAVNEVPRAPQTGKETEREHEASWRYP